MYLKDFEHKITNNPTLSNEARELSQKIMSHLRIGEGDISLSTSKVVLGEICRACEITSNKTKDINQWYYGFWNDSSMDVSVMVSTEVSLLETIGNALNPNN